MPRYLLISRIEIVDFVIKLSSGGNGRRGDVCSGGMRVWGRVEAVYTLK